MADIVYPPIIGAMLASFRMADMRFDLVGDEHVPQVGGAVLASNHVSYPDFIFCGYAARPSRRLVRFMAKDQVFRHSLGGPLMRGMHHIPVDRDAGTDAYRHAVASLRAGEVVGVFPEATISRSFELKGFKSGAARMAAEAQVPLLPMITWGGQLLWTKGRPRSLTRRHVTIGLTVGEPLRPAPGDDPAEVTAALKERMDGLLQETLHRYPVRPLPGRGWWWPRRFGGEGMTLEEAGALDAADAEHRRARRA